MASSVPSLCRFFILLVLYVSYCHSRPGLVDEILGTNSTNENAAQCDSCRDVVGFTRRLFDTSDLNELKTNLTAWCVTSGNGVNDQVCRTYIEDGLSALDRVGSSYFCERVHVCPKTDSVSVDDIKANNDTKCDFCLNVVKSLKEIVASPETEKEFKEFLVNGCLHIGAVKDECMELVDKNLDTLFRYMRERMNPEQVCSSTGCCVTSRQDEINVALSIADKFVNIGPVDLSNASNTGEIIPLISLTPVETTELTGLYKPDPVKCLMCRRMITDLMKRVKDNKTEEAIVTVLDGVCVRIFHQKEQLHQCEKFVKDYTDEVIAIIVQEDDPKKICQMLNVCAHKKDLGEVDSSGDSDDLALCHQCVFSADWVLNQIQSSPDSNKTDAIDYALSRMCNETVPIGQIKSCLQFTHSGRKGLLRNIVSKHSSAYPICKEVSLCSPSKVTDSIEGFERESESLQSNPLPSCIVCKKLVKWIHTHVKGNSSERAIEDALDKICLHMKDVEKCEEKVKIWSRQIVTAIRLSTNPDVVCITLGECGIYEVEASVNEIDSSDKINTESAVETSTQPEISGENGGVCYECQMISHFIQRELYDYEKEKKVEQFVISKVCEKVKEPEVKETCESFVDQYGASIIQLISQKAFDPKTLCQDELRVCPKVHPTPPPREANSSPLSTAIEPKMDIEFTNGPNTTEMCSMCEVTVRQLDSVLTFLAPAEKRAEQTVTEVCSLFDEQKQQQCHDIMQAFGAHLQYLIGRLSNANEVCRSIDLCYQPGHLHLLGGSKCTFGPTYWCYTAAHAEACKATDYCKNKVWKAVEQISH